MSRGFHILVIAWCVAAAGCTQTLTHRQSSFQQAVPIGRDSFPASANQPEVQSPINDVNRAAPLGSIVADDRADSSVPLGSSASSLLPAVDLRDPLREDAPNRVAVLHLGRPRHLADPTGCARNILGIHVTAERLRAAARRLHDDAVDTVILDISLQGGYWSEAQLIQHILRDEFLPRFRTIAWIDEAVGGAAMAFAVVPSVYFRSSAIYGPCPISPDESPLSTPWVTVSTARPTIDPDPVVLAMQRACAVGGYDPLIFRSMMLAEPLSIRTSPDDATSLLSPSELPGRIINPTGRLLTLNAQSAERTRFSRGTVDTIEELLVAAGIEHVQFVGRAAGHDLDFVAAQARTDESRIIELLTSIRSRLLLTDSAIEGSERDTQAEVASRNIDELEYLLTRNGLYRRYLADEAQVPPHIGEINRVWFQVIRQGLDALRRRRLPLDDVAESIQM